MCFATLATPAGFEPARAEPNGFQVHRLNHSAIVSNKFPPRFELGLLDSKSKVLTVTPWELCRREGFEPPLQVKKYLRFTIKLAAISTACGIRTHEVNGRQQVIRSGSEGDQIHRIAKLPKTSTTRRPHAPFDLTWITLLFKGVVDV